MNNRYEAVLALISKISLGDPARALPVENFGLVYPGRGVSDGLWTFQSCLAESITFMIEHKQTSLLNLTPITLNQKATLSQPYLFQAPLRHYLLQVTGWDKTNETHQSLPIVVKAQGQWHVVDGAHRYVADLLMGRPTQVLAVAAKVPCYCSAAHVVVNAPPIQRTA